MKSSSSITPNLNSENQKVSVSSNVKQNKSKPQTLREQTFNGYSPNSSHNASSSLTIHVLYGEIVNVKKISSE